MTYDPYTLACLARQRIKNRMSGPPFHVRDILPELWSSLSWHLRGLIGKFFYVLYADGWIGYDNEGVCLYK